MPTPRTLTDDEVTQIADVILPDRDWLTILLMLDAGLRVGELVQLQLLDVYAVNQPVSTLCVRAETTKTKTCRYIPLTARLKTAIRAYCDQYFPQPTFKPSDWLFPSIPSTFHISTRSIQRRIFDLFFPICKRSITPHMLRHTFATRIMRTTNARVCQELLGHKKLSSTQVYTHPNHDDLTKAIDAL